MAKGKEYNPIKTLEHTKRINDAGLNVNANSMYNSTMLRDQNFDINQKMMFKAERNLDFSFKLGLAFQLFMCFLSAVWFFHNVVRVVSAPLFTAIASLTPDYYEANHIEWMTSGCLVMFPFTLLGIVMTILANKFMSNKFTFWLYVSYALYALVGVTAYFSLWDDFAYAPGMNVIFGTLISIIAFTGLTLCNHTHDAVKDIEYLVTQEGFPTFNSAMFYMHSSKFVKYREKWEKKHKSAADYKAVDATEVAEEKIIVTAPDSPDRMDYVAVHEDDVNESLNEKETVFSSKKEETKGMMDELDTGNIILDETDYHTNDNRLKSLD